MPTIPPAWGYAVKDISTSREGEAPAEPQAFLTPRQTFAVRQEPHPPIALNAMAFAITSYLPYGNPSRRSHMGLVPTERFSRREPGTNAARPMTLQDCLSYSESCRNREWSITR